MASIDCTGADDRNPSVVTDATTASGWQAGQRLRHHRADADLLWWLASIGQVILLGGRFCISPVRGLNTRLPFWPYTPASVIVRKVFDGLRCLAVRGVADLLCQFVQNFVSLQLSRMHGSR